MRSWRGFHQCSTACDPCRPRVRAPERLLKVLLLIALYTVRSKRTVCEEFENNLHSCWFRDMDLIERGFNTTAFTKNRQRLLAHERGVVPARQGVAAADGEGLLRWSASIDSELQEHGIPLGTVLYV